MTFKDKMSVTACNVTRHLPNVYTTFVYKVVPTNVYKEMASVFLLPFVCKTIKHVGKEPMESIKGLKVMPSLYVWCRARLNI